MKKENLRKLVFTAIFAAIVVVLQLFVSIPLGPMFTITLTLVPVMLGAILFGPSSGAILGGVFGIVVAIQVSTGAAGPASSMMLAQAPITTIVLCILKGAVAGLVSGLIYKAIMKLKKPRLAVILSAVSCPIVNTSIFCLGLTVFYNNLLHQWTIGEGYANAFTFIMLGMVGLNFVIEFAVNVLLIPVALRMIKIVKQRL